MGKRAVVAGMLASMAITLLAQKPAWEPAPGHSQLPIWPHGAPGSGSNPGPGAAAEVDTTTAKDNLIAGKPLIRLGNVSTPTITRLQGRRGLGRRARCRGLSRRRLSHPGHRSGRHRGM